MKNGLTSRYSQRPQAPVVDLGPLAKKELMSDGDIKEALGNACEVTRSDLIIRGRRMVARVIEEDGIEAVERVAYAHLNLRDDWEYRRFGEVLATYHREALTRLVEFGLQSQNPEIVEAAVDIKADPSHFSFRDEKRA